MKLQVELDEVTFARVTRGERELLYVPVRLVEVRQRDGLLTQQFRCQWIETLGSQVAADQGLPPGSPNVRIWLLPEGEDHVRNK